MRYTQEEQIRAAEKAYIIRIGRYNRNSMTDRFAVYLDAGAGLTVLWPSDSHNGKKSAELLPGQCYSNRENLPAFHFRLGGCGYSKYDEVRRELRCVNPNLDVSRIEIGWSPGASF